MNRDEEVLRRVLNAEAAKVDVEARALVEIREKIKVRRARWWHPFTARGATLLSSTAVALTAGVAAVLIGFSSCAPPAPAPLPPGSAGPTGGFITSIGPSGETILRLPVYYLGPSATGSGLYREYHPLPGGDRSIEQLTTVAVNDMLGARPLDPDYASPWPAGARVRQVRRDGSTVTIDLAGAAANSVDAATARQAVQQLVWTATAVSGLTDVRLLLDGQEVPTLWGQAPVVGALVRGNAVDVLAPVWLIDPQEGSVVGKTLTVYLAGIVFEATAQLRVRDAAGTVVHQQVVQLDKGAPNQGQASLEVTLPPGDYTVQAYYLSANDGSEQAMDDHTITVR
jgi:hypothetical protein